MAFDAASEASAAETEEDQGMSDPPDQVKRPDSPAETSKVSSAAKPESPQPVSDKSGDAVTVDYSGIIVVYQNLQEACGKILAESSDGDNARRLAEGHAYIQELESWAQVLEPRKECQLLGVAVREYQLALLALAQGLYRQAFKGLRLVLELCLQSVHLSAYQVELREWLESRKDTIWSTLVNTDNGVLSVRFALAFFPDLKDHVRHYHSLASQLYRECSECVHGNVPKHIILPDSLEFSGESFALWLEKAQNAALVIAFTLALRYLKELNDEELKVLEHDVVDRLGHIAAIRAHFGGPEGG